MVLKCKAICTKVKKKSRSPAFVDLQVGDAMEFSVPIKSAGNGSRGTYATYIICHNERTGVESRLSFNQIGKTLDNFDFEECE